MVTLYVHIQLCCTTSLLRGDAFDTAKKCGERLKYRNIVASSLLQDQWKTGNSTDM
ncbi:predicted protein [Sclerotinia sclerotiorum 1980 UF-70]|uniref:Uncharacterized protein n=1 Tax=Sclerotinia sclerotiorum (strain ATCC 18683 / 1980 / Ss-1) TaxID=665079 RepID=A7EX73_SCLS1|nr:predicted protein [Sclerotinia sclerotiorum 1980 UF-70]EDN94065.1 predicted protein [Sclerotinia sclerotiorum 1980 UF-70]